MYLLLVINLLIVAAQDRPKIESQNGILVLTAAKDKDINIKTSGEGNVLINQENVVAMVKSIRETINNLNIDDKTDKSDGLQNFKQIIDGISQRLQTIEQNSTSLLRIGDKVDTQGRNLRIVRNLLRKNECESNPCSNGGTCLDVFANFLCICRDNWEGARCETDVNECATFIGTELGCQNGATCINKPGTYECQCASGWFGIHCTKPTLDCSSSTEMCGHGTCIPQKAGIKCICDEGWKTDGVGPACNVDINECEAYKPHCSINPAVNCINLPGTFHCANCPIGYTGNGFYCSDIDECAINNGGCNPQVQCINTPGSRICGLCPPGTFSKAGQCINVNICSINNGGCHPVAQCRDNSQISSTYRECICPASYVGNGIGDAGCLNGATDLCTPNPCQYGNCSIEKNDFVCNCNRMYTGKTCNIRKNPCDLNPCQNGGACIRVAFSYICRCTNFYTGLNCETERQTCGSLYGSTGTLIYPLSNSTLPTEGKSCAWIINTTPEKVLNITFKSFNFPRRNNFLQINDGGNAAAQLIGRFTGTSLPKGGNFASTSHKLYIWLKHDAITPRPKFSLIWNDTDPICGGNVNISIQGQFNSPGTPGSYPPNRDCYWRFKAPFGKRIQFYFYTFNLTTGSNNNCSKDYLSFFSGLEPTDPLIIKYCNFPPEPLISTGPEVLAHFHSGEGSSNLGFQASYSVVPGIPGCGGTYSMDEGEITAPTIDGSYINGVSCEFKIRLLSPSNVRIKFSQMDIETSDTCRHDYVAIYNGESIDSPLIGRYCGTNIPGQISMWGSAFLIHFNSDKYLSKTGFKLRYEVVCGGKSMEPNGVIESPNYPNSKTIQSRKECIYEILQAHGNRIILNISNISIGKESDNCAYGYLEVRDGNDDNSTLIGRYCKKAPIIYSTYNILRLRYVLLPGITSGFHLQYKTISNDGCGGILTSKLGSIESPNNLNLYEHGLNCSWLIKAPSDNVIQIVWIKFSIESTPSCKSDRVTLIDNSTTPGIIMGVYCGDNFLPPTLISSGNLVTVEFEIDGHVNLDGFLFTYHFLQEKNLCGGNFFAPSGVLKSPNYPEIYPANKDCVWTITVPEGQKILLNATHFDVENHTRCGFDFVEIRNGGTAASPLVGKFCGKHIPKEIPSHTHQMYIRFKSDSTGRNYGFSFNWNSLATGCGGTLTAPTGVIQSPNYPAPYGKYAECFWKILVSAGSIIQLLFGDLELENHNRCILDHIEIFDGVGESAKSLGKFCNKEYVPDFIRTTKNSMTIKFRSDMSYQGRGFQLQYSAICQNTIKGFQGVIESPNFPANYPHSQNCIWNIEVALGNKINITFSNFEIEGPKKIIGNNCSDTNALKILYIDLQDSEKTYLTYDSYCGLDIPKDIHIPSNEAEIRLTTDSFVLGGGFRLEWTIDGCGGVLSHPAGTIMTPNYPLPYNISTKCEWLIQTDYGQSIEITFPVVNLEQNGACDYDYIAIYAGSNDTYPLQMKFCNTKTYTVVTSNGNQMFVVFESDNSYNGIGFLANYKTVTSKCGGKIKGNSGNIHTPNYPKNFDKNDTCIWEIEVEENHIIHLKFKDVDFYKNCNKSYIKIHDGPSQAYPVLAAPCGNKTPNETISSSGNHMTIEMVTNFYYSAKGFLAEYSLGCGAHITTQSSGLIEFSKDTLHATEFYNCSWTIESVRPDEHIFLTFLFLKSAYCNPNDDTNGIRVYDGDDNKAPLIGSYCESAPPMIRSTGSKLHIEVHHVDNYITARYTVVDTECGGALESEKGFFATPNYPLAYPTDRQCEWTLKASPGNKVTVQFSDFHISNSEECNEDYLEIREFNSTGKLIGVYCGDETPSNPIVASSLWLFFKSAKQLNESISSTAKGFKAEYTFVHGNTLTSASGQIASPLYPRSFDSYEMEDYTWKIIVRPRYKITIKFLDFDLDLTHEDCTLTYLQIFDGGDENAPQHGPYCGVELPDVITTTTNVAVIKINYDSSRRPSKFLLEWNSVFLIRRLPYVNISQTNSGCGSDDTIFIEDDTRYNISSPNYPGNYPKWLTCNWIFQTTKDKHLAIRFPVVDLIHLGPCMMGDKITIYSGLEGTTDFTYVSTVCKDNTTLFHETTNLMKVTFKSVLPNGFTFISKMGFLGYVYSVCGGQMDDPNGIIEIKNYTNTISRKNNKDCEWKITVKTGRTIKVEFTDFHLGEEEKCNSYLMLKNGQYSTSPLLGSGKYCGNTLPENLITSGNYLFVKYHSAFQATHFKLKYSEVAFACGGKIVLTEFNNSTIINSPNYPNIPQPHSECIWVISVPAGEAVRLDFQEPFDLNDNNNCIVESVEIRDGGTFSSPLIGKFCENIPSSQKTIGNMMFIKYYTNSDDPKTGFQAKVSIASCGGIIRANAGEIKSPNFNKKNLYPVNMDCKWEIVAHKGHTVQLNFDVLDLPMSLTKNCSDYVSISEYNIINQTENRIGKYCGKSPPSPITISGYQVYIHFKTGANSRQYNGFKIRFNTSDSKCGGILTTDFGTINSPGYPIGQSYRTACVWSIQVTEGRQIKFEMLDEDIGSEDRMHRLIFRNRTFGIGWEWKANSSSRIFRSSDNVMQIIYFSHEVSKHRGFKAKYSSDEPTICIGNINGESGTINPLNESIYSCRWRRSTGIINKTIAFMINASFSKSLNQCTITPKLQIHFDDSSRFYGDVDICKNTNGIKIIRSSRPKVAFSVIQDSSSNSMNFTMSYKTYACGGVLSNSYGYITSPGYPKQTTDYECSWIIKTEMEQTLLLKFIDFNLGDDCSKSYLLIYNGDSLSSPRIGKYCRDSLPPNIQPQSYKVLVEYHVESNSNGKGFNFTYEPVTKGCGGIHHVPKSVLQTPGYPKPYLENVECLWEIIVSPGYHISLTFVDQFQIESSKDCANDFIQVYENPENATKYCGRNAPFNTYNSSSTKLYVLFRSDGSTNGIGFRVKWTQSCGGTLNVDDKLRYVISPAYPNNYATYLNCQYNFVAPNKYININFEDFQLENGYNGLGNCRYDKLSVMDSGLRYRQRDPVNFCGTNKPPPITLKNKVIVTFTTDGFVSARGFKLTYQLDTCGGNITEPTIISKIEDQASIRQSQGESKSCRWTIQAPKKYRVILSVTELSVWYSRACTREYLNVNYGKLGTFCGNKTGDDIPIIHSENENMNVFLRYYMNSYTKRSFKASVYFRKGPELGCGGDITIPNNTTKTIEILNENDTDCVWTFRTGIDHTFKVEFLENKKCITRNNSDNCSCILYEVREGFTSQSKLIERLCNFDSPFTYPKLARNLYIRIIIGNAGSHTPKIRITSVPGLCGSTILRADTKPKYITSPNFPSPYPKNFVCQWTITADAIETIRRSKVLVRLIEVNLNDEVSSDDNSCDNKDQLKFRTLYSFYSRYNGMIDSVTICNGKNKVSEFYLSVSLGLTFISNNEEKHGKGFKLEYQIPSCTRNYTALSGSIETNIRSDCSIYIIVPENYTIALYFSKFTSHPDGVCAQVFDGDETKKKLLEHCISVIPKPVFSTGNRLYIKSRNKAYDITYIANNKSRGCGGDILALHGVITSPMYPEPYANNSLCTWTITMPFGLNMVLKFLKFDVLGDCTENYVAISTKFEEEINRRVFCNGDNPAEIIANGKITVDYKTSINNIGTGWSLQFKRSTSNATGLD